MTEKRFVNEDDCYGYYTEIIDNEKELDLSLPNPKKNLTIEELVDLLNEQHEQINTLRESRRELISANNEYRMRETELAQELSTLVDENEELKKDYDYLEKRFKEEEWHYDHIDEDRDVWMYKCHKLEKKNKEFKEKLNSVSDIIDEQIWQVNHTHENCKKVGIAELKKLKKVLICNSIIQDGDLDD